jgi:hypothetical protein
LFILQGSFFGMANQPILIFAAVVASDLAANRLFQF